MREILFKAKRIDNGEWAEGHFVKYQPCASRREYIYGIVPIYASALYIIEIDPNTICQYTGLKDKNDQKLWENDIVENGNRGGKIVYRNCCFEIDWFQYSIYSGKYIKDFTQQLFQGRNFVSIGNVFDNPGLLEV